jgi:FkbM family methyltransferase
MKPKYKEMLGHVLLETCDRLPVARPALKRFGLRTSQEWFRDEVVNVPLDTGKILRLGSIADNYLSFELFWRGVDYYEPITTLLARELAAGSATFIDAGANIGFCSLILSIYNPGLNVIAFEPNPKNFRLLEQNVELNGLPVRCEPIALSDRTGTLSLYVSASDMSASLESSFEDHLGAVPVTATTLDSYLEAKDIRKPVIIKVDVEGHEGPLFRGAPKTIARFKPDIITEVTHTENPEMIAMLKAEGYRFYQITDQGLLPSDELRLVVRDRFVFLNHLLTMRPPRDVEMLFNRIRARVARIDLTQTSKCVAPELLSEMLVRNRAYESQQSQSGTPYRG